MSYPKDSLQDGPAHGGGLNANCPTCIVLYRASVGPNIPLCVLCDSYHWAYEYHAVAQ